MAEGGVLPESAIRRLERRAGSRWEWVSRRAEWRLAAAAAAGDLGATAVLDGRFLSGERARDWQWSFEVRMPDGPANPLGGPTGRPDEVLAAFGAIAARPEPGLVT